ncbi:DUF202 domain-containing protein [Rubrobacter indicoceani]|uniref:DUF202 domain-containing protein n=1 Tax=Rubrobacter indicoceani TaxID=2051957 RepID=UPI000E5BC7E8|nr:DUF202 domain-containing protein [Rubrobacter indicoceani]
MERRVPDGETLAREHLAGERTVLSWVRIGMNAVGVGIVLYALAGLVFGHIGEFRVFALALVVFGGGVQVVALARFVAFTRGLRRGVLTSSANVYLLLVFGFVLLAAAYAVFVGVS